MSKTPRLRYKDLNLFQLSTFCEVCRRGGFSAAAKTLHLTTPTVWERMRGLEAQYGVPLLARRGNRITPTPEGQHLLEVLRPLLAGLDSTRELIRQQKGVPPARIQIVSSLRVHMHEIMQALRRFHQRHPSVQLQVREEQSRNVIPALVEGDAEVAIMLKPAPGATASSAVLFEEIDRLEFLLVAPPSHPLIRGKRLQLADLVKHPLILGNLEAFSRKRFEDVLEVHHLEGRASVAVQTGSASLTLAAVRAGLGAGVVVCHPSGVLLKGLRTRSLGRWFGAAQLVFVWKRGVLVPALCRELADAIRATIRELGAP